MLVVDKDILGLSTMGLDAAGGGLTAREIAQQPAVWPQIDALVQRSRASLDAFLGPLLRRPELRIVLTGAGTSAFVGECLAPAMLGQGLRAEAVPTTDIVSGPLRFLQPAVPTLLVSFARSGSSPESIAAVELADQLVKDVHHLVITCNADGELYRMAQGRSNACAILLPDETHDRGFAMTTSFTSMLLAAALAFSVLPAGAASAPSVAAEDVHATALPLLQSLVAQQFKRVVYLGSNELRGLAREASLKLLELTDGRVVALFDSPLGFRHGPKTIVDDETLVVVLLSNDAQARRYDLDLLRELRNDGRAGRVLALSGQAAPELGTDCVVLKAAADVSDLALALPYILFCQSFALLQSLAQGIRPDTPSASGTVNRVVRGVTIYPYAGELHVPRG
ncbi:MULTISPECIES: SIS domain-containing protein [unclassified Duganella]|jgi:tagatose-6-phosphate ketose/aldose isomerase|uniref:SIS domain-containing protein n=1 Tax=unclassified Duganella TaxID=2636909 RepID=UPI00088B28DF|nr:MULTISPECIES: SIS domain-containing protein [unclassified Duganella]SDG38800.1 tagatose-6-phosphate ketose/aldose isomerase [Duganella sp. OV458]SDJ64968.1 galactosamine 6-phosphate isomerase AgaS [Duganella sp. OV510]